MAKFIVMVRNPIDMFSSLHSQLFFERNEKIKDASIAWHIQERRRLGYDIPRLCVEPKFLQYGVACQLGSQLTRLYDLVAKERVKTIVFDDFITNTSSIYEEVLDFLGLPSEGRVDFKVFNQSRTIRLKVVADLIATFARSHHFLRVFKATKKIIGIETSGLSRLNTRVQKRTNMPVSLKVELSKYFRDDVNILSELIGRDLSHWLTGFERNHVETVSSIAGTPKSV